MIKTKNSKPPSKCKCVTNGSSLPSKCHNGDVWAKQVIPTLIYWLGCQLFPWSPPPEQLLKAIKITCEEVYTEDIIDQIPLTSTRDEPAALVSVLPI